MVYDPKKGTTVKERLDLKGNPSVKEDWYKIRKTGEEINFLTFARTEGRFGKHFDEDDNPSPEILASQEERLRNWKLLQELSGIGESTTPSVPEKKSKPNVASKQKKEFLARRKTKKEKNVTTE